MLKLSPVEARVLGALMEKETTTPEYYPLSLNALVNACNQKSNREPVMELSEADVRTALFELESIGLVRVQSDARVSKFEHLAYSYLNLRRPDAALLCLLLLRGPQTAAELRSRAERLFTFDDTTAATETLERLSLRTEPDLPLAVQLARQPGSRESRWSHTLCGEVENVAIAGSAGSYASAAAQTSVADQERLAALEAEVSELKNRVEALEAKLTALVS